jgi:thiol-disulfide isomerase/thioredoxin
MIQGGSSQTEREEIILETREDLTNFLINTEYEYTILKFYADWCRPCKAIAPFVDQVIEEKIRLLDEKGLKKRFIFIEVDVDECFDLYAFLKRKKRINGIPSIFLYSKSVYSKLDTNEIFIPQGCVSGTKEGEIRKVLDYIK